MFLDTAMNEFLILCFKSTKDALNMERNCVNLIIQDLLIYALKTDPILQLSFLKCVRSLLLFLRILTRLLQADGTFEFAKFSNILYLSFSKNIAFYSCALRFYSKQVIFVCAGSLFILGRLFFMVFNY